MGTGGRVPGGISENIGTLDGDLGFGQVFDVEAFGWLLAKVKSEEGGKVFAWMRVVGP